MTEHPGKVTFQPVKATLLIEMVDGSSMLFDVESALQQRLVVDMKTRKVGESIVGSFGILGVITLSDFTESTNEIGAGE